MSDDPTREIPDSRPFEERVFARFDTLDLRLTTLEEKVDSRLRETRPIWEAMQADLANVKDDLSNVKNDLSNVKNDLASVKSDLAGVKDDLAGVKDDLTNVKTDLANVRGDVKEIKHVLKVLHKDIVRVRSEQEDLDERVEKLESQSTR